jgi:hypothetical protein
VITPPGLPKAQSGKFPDLSNLPTMIAESDDTPPPAEPAELAPTAMAGDIVDPNARTSMQMQAPNPAAGIQTVIHDPNAQNGGRPSGSGPAPDPRASDPMPQMDPRASGQMPPMQRPPSSQQLQRQSMQQLQQARPSNLPTSYPVMDRQLSQQVASGATVFPSARPSHANVSDSGPQDQQRMVDLASPVGSGYGDNVDWSQAAAAPARAIPPWMLAVIFVGAIGVALLVTIIIAKIVR